MLTRRQFLERTLKGTSLLALGPAVPGFLTATARAAEPGKDTVLVVLEMTGGNDGLNTVIPYGDDLYYKARPKIGLKKNDLVKVDEHIGLNPGLRGLEKLLQDGQLAIVQGVGYPNPDRSHFESMDIWQSAQVARRGSKPTDGWLGRSMGLLKLKEGSIPALHLGADRLPLALQGGGVGAVSVHPGKGYRLNLGGDNLPADPHGRLPQPPFRVAENSYPQGDATTERNRAERMSLIKELAEGEIAANQGMLQFVQRSSLQTYSTLERLEELLKKSGPQRNPYQSFDGRTYRNGELARDLALVAGTIAAGFGTRLFYVSIPGFDTHSGQVQVHQSLLQEVGSAVSFFFGELKRTQNDKRVVLMTFSEFGRRVHDNGSDGTDHGAASCLFVAGAAIKGGLVGKHPSLKDLDAGDLKHHTDFRQVYATLLDKWLECDSRRVLAEKYEHVELIK